MRAPYFFVCPKKVGKKGHPDGCGLRLPGNSGILRGTAQFAPAQWASADIPVRWPHKIPLFPAHHKGGKNLAVTLRLFFFSIPIQARGKSVSRSRSAQRGGPAFEPTPIWRHYWRGKGLIGAAFLVTFFAVEKSDSRSHSSITTKARKAFECETIV